MFHSARLETVHDGDLVRFWEAAIGPVSASNAREMLEHIQYLRNKTRAGVQVEQVCIDLDGGPS